MCEVQLHVYAVANMCEVHLLVYAVADMCEAKLLVYAGGASVVQCKL
jgi:hypothetical protein